MGIAEISADNVIIIFSHIITYGNAAGTQITNEIREEIESMWNEPAGVVGILNQPFAIQFKIAATFNPHLSPQDIFNNHNPANNFFRIEEYAIGSISFVDGLGCNTGYFKLENLYKGSTTAAHEYGHTLGLDHPQNLDIRGQGVPGIMYPRGTIVDAAYQYDPSKSPGVTGGTMYPIHRKVKQEDINNLNIYSFAFKQRRAVVGNFSNVWHDDHRAAV